MSVRTLSCQANVNRFSVHYEIEHEHHLESFDWLRPVIEMSNSTIRLQGKILNLINKSIDFLTEVRNLFVILNNHIGIVQ